MREVVQPLMAGHVGTPAQPQALEDMHHRIVRHRGARSCQRGMRRLLRRVSQGLEGG